MKEEGIEMKKYYVEGSWKSRGRLGGRVEENEEEE